MAMVCWVRDISLRYYLPRLQWLDKVRETYINDTLNALEGTGDGRANDGNAGDETGLANEDVEESLVNTDELSKGGLNG
jgi:hypothetical protein